MNGDRPPSGDEPSLSRKQPRLYDIRLGGTHRLLHLAQCLDSEEPAIRRRAALQLAEAGDERAVDTLIEALENLDFRLNSQRLRAVNILGALRDTRAVSFLATLASCTIPITRTYPDKQMRIAAIRALQNIGGTEAIAALRKAVFSVYYFWAEPNKEAVRALVALGDDGLLEYLLLLAQSQNEEAIIALGCLRDRRATDHLLDMLQQTALFPKEYPEQRFKRAVIRALGESGDERVFEALMQIVGLGLPLPLPPPQTWFDGHEEDIIAGAFAALGNLRDPRAVEALIQVAQSWPWGEGSEGYWRATGNLITALGQLGDARAVKVIEYGLQPGLCLRAALVALGQIGGDVVVEPLLNMSIKKLSSFERELRVEVLSTLYTIDSRVREAILGALEDRHQNVRKQAVWVLGEHRERLAVEALIHHMNEDTPSVRKAARVALRKIGTKQALEALASQTA